MSDIDIVDRIDALVDEQLANYDNRSGWDLNVNQPTCWYCDRDFHGLKITKRIEQMKRLRRMDPDYRYADDDSDVICPGPGFVGPWASPAQLREIKRLEPWEAMRTNFAIGGVVSISSSNGWTQIGVVDRIEASRIFGEAVVSIQAHMSAFSESITTAMESVSATFSGIASHLDLEPDTRTPQQRALPRPSTTPPMWANDVTRSRRPRRNRNQPNRQGIA